MSDFKVGDWVNIEGAPSNDVFQLTKNEVKHQEILLGNFAFGMDKWKHRKHKVGDFCQLPSLFLKETK